MKILYLLSALLLFDVSSSVAQSIASVYTNYGKFEVYLEDTLAPITVGNFIKLANEKYYDGVLFHRVISNFMIQGGDATLTGGKKALAIMDEFHDSLSNVKGTISMANSGPNTGTSQFFINVKDNVYLDYNKQPTTSKHAVFGHVSTGYAIVDSISKVQTTGNLGNPRNRPIKDVIMDSVRITKPFVPSFVISIDTKHGYKLYPNPTTGSITLSTQSGKLEKVELIDVTGSVVFSMMMQDNVSTFDVSYLNEGTYILKLVEGGEIHFNKIILRR